MIQNLPFDPGKHTTIWSGGWPARSGDIWISQSPSVKSALTLEAVRLWGLLISRPYRYLADGLFGDFGLFPRAERPIVPEQSGKRKAT